MKISKTILFLSIILYIFSCSQNTTPSNQNGDTNTPDLEELPEEEISEEEIHEEGIPETIFQSSVITSQTAIPTFIGYTGISDSNTPVKIRSMNEFRQQFGHRHKTRFHIPENIFDPNEFVDVEIYGIQFLLYESLELFFANGGSECFVVSVGTFFDVPNRQDLTRPLSSDGVLSKEKNAAIIVIPDALFLTDTECYDTYQLVLQHCNRTGNRFGIFDIHNGFNPEKMDADISNFRNKIGSNDLNRGAVYYPWMNSSLISLNEVDFNYFVGGLGDLRNIINKMDQASKDKALTLFNTHFPNGSANGLSPEEYKEKSQLLNTGLVQQIPSYKMLLTKIQKKLNLLPVGGIMAGVYNKLDKEKGVWKAPANVSLTLVVEPSVSISDKDQEGLNVSMTDGKSINAIRNFTGKGVLVWGARTLNGNSQEWRYISVRRYFDLIETSVKQSLFEFRKQPNNQTTWSQVKALTNNFLEEEFRKGALQGAKAEDAYSVDIGLGKTMTASDISEGRMIMSIRLALVRPQEFIVITLEQQME